jgi:hypothetical protein
MISWRAANSSQAAVPIVPSAPITISFNGFPPYSFVNQNYCSPTINRHFPDNLHIDFDSTQFSPSLE